MTPREKLKERGVQSLTISELVAIIIGHGNRRKSVYEMSNITSAILLKYNVCQLSVDKFDKSIGLINISKIMACIELGRRLQNSNLSTQKIISARDVWLVTKHAMKGNQEKVLALYLDGSQRLLEMKVIAKGKGNCADIDLRIMFSEAFKLLASSIILVHNHPSGKLDPSVFDLDTTRTLVTISNMLGFNLLDHIIVTIDGYKSIIKT